jgi:hypothetical protein
MTDRRSHPPFSTGEQLALGMVLVGIFLFFVGTIMAMMMIHERYWLIGTVFMLGGGLLIGVALFLGEFAPEVAPPDPEPKSAPPPTGLSPDDLDELFASMPDITPEARAHAQLLAKALIKEKSNS